MSLFIYAVGFVIVALLAWIGFELHQQRADARLNYIIGRLEAQIETSRPEPQLFDQEVR